MRMPTAVVVLILVLAPTLALAQQGGRMSFGGDEYAAGQSASLDAAAERDAFAAGYDVSIRAPVAGDAHLAGFNVTAGGDIAGDLYAAGFNVGVTGTVAGDVTAMGNTVSVSSAAPVGGNLRLAGQTVSVASEVAGSALITAQTATLSKPVRGDVSFLGETLNFGADARIDGTLTIRAPREIAVPPSVAPPERVRFEQVSGPDYVGEAGRTAEHVVRSVWPAVWATGLWWLLLFVVGAVFIALAPRLVASLQQVAAVRPLRRIGLGLVALAAVLGTVPVLAMTVIGLVLVPFGLVFVFIAWSLGYLAGVYLLGLRIVSAVTRADTNWRRLGVLAAAIVVAGLLAMIPVIGWLLTLVLLCFGLGAIATRLLRPAPTETEAAPLPAA